MNTATFSLHGDYMTSLVRDLYVEGSWRKAIRILARGIEGLSTDQAIAILRGQHKLVGDSRSGSLAMDDDVGEDRVRDYEAVLGAQFEADGCWWEPYAMVGVLAHPDFRRAQRSVEADSCWYAGGDTSTKNRAVQYADDRRNDRAELVTIDAEHKIALFRKAKEPPFWINGVASWDASVRNYAASGRTLRRVGHDDADPLAVYSDDGKTELEQWQPRDSQGVEARLIAMGAAAGLPQEAVAGTVAAIVGAEDRYSTDQVEPDEMGLNGYILPGGACHRCLYHAHRELAEALGLDPDDPEQAADAAGWLRLKSSDAARPSGGIICRKPTRAQLEAYALWAAAHGLKDHEPEILILRGNL